MRALILLLTLLIVLAKAVSASADGPLVYVVQPGDTLSAIAQRYQTTPDAIVHLNDLSDPDQLVAGQKLTVLSVNPGEMGAADTTAAHGGPMRNGQPQRVHIVQAGETLSQIAASEG